MAGEERIYYIEVVVKKPKNLVLFLKSPNNNDQGERKSTVLAFLVTLKIADQRIDYWPN